MHREPRERRATPSARLVRAPRPRAPGTDRCRRRLEVRATGPPPPPAAGPPNRPRRPYRAADRPARSRL